MPLEPGSTAARAVEPVSAAEVFTAWERLRLPYNGLLGLLVVVHVIGGLLAAEATLPLMARAAVGANVCFCAGPVAEGYLDWLGMPRRRGRWLAFGVGSALSLVLASITLVAPRTFEM